MVGCQISVTTQTHMYTHTDNTMLTVKLCNMKRRQCILFAFKNQIMNDFFHVLLYRPVISTLEKKSFPQRYYRLLAGLRRLSSSGIAVYWPTFAVTPKWAEW